MKYIIAAAIAIFIIFLAVLNQIPLGIEPLTELYFENHTILRANIFSDKVYNFSFTVHNIEYQEMGYNYTIKALDTNNTIIKEISSGNIILQDNQTKTTLAYYKLDKGFERSKILVTINKDHLNITPEFKTKLWWPDPNYPNQIQIHFWIDEVVPIQIIHVPD